MNAPAPFLAHSPALRIRWFMGAGWILILLKCAFVTWAVDHWRMPFHAGWVVLPTLAFATLATVVWLVHRD